jgi:hypothetical protein
VSAQTCFKCSNETPTSSASERVYLYLHKFESERTKLKAAQSGWWTVKNLVIKKKSSGLYFYD